MRTLLAAAILAALTICAAGAGQTRLAFAGPSGGISGRVIVENEPNRVDAYTLLVVPANVPQPLTDQQRFQFSVPTDTAGNFRVTELADGDYLVAIAVDRAEYVTPLPESVSFQSPSGEQTWGALRVIVSGGEALEGIDIVIRIPQVVVVDPLPTFTPTPIGLPPTGQGPSGAPAAPGRLVAAVGIFCLAGVLSVVVGVRLGRAPLHHGRQERFKPRQ